MENRRKLERRNWGIKPNFPLVDSNGNIATKNRRRILERRAEIDLPDNPTNSQINSSLVQLSLKYRNKILQFDSSDKNVNIGRGTNSAVIINENHASRNHASFTLTKGGVSFTDHSRNGTYVQFNDGSVGHIRDEQVAINGTGIISIGKPIQDGSDNLIYFSCE